MMNSNYLFIDKINLVFRIREIKRSLIKINLVFKIREIKHSLIKINLVFKIREIKHSLIEVLFKKQRSIYVKFLKVKM